MCICYSQAPNLSFPLALYLCPHGHKCMPLILTWKAMENTGIFLHLQDIPIWNNPPIVMMKSSVQTTMYPLVVWGRLSCPLWILSPESKVAHSCPTLCDPMDYTVHGILQATILEWVVFPFSRGFSQPRDRTQVSCIAGGFFTNWETRGALMDSC